MISTTTNVTRAARLSLIALCTLALASSGCSDGGPVGSICGGDSDCGYGLQCFKPFEDATPVCTIGCEEAPCAQGVCIDTLHGFVCAGLCVDKICREGLACQGAETGEDVCWYSDTNLDALPEGVVIGRVDLSEDTNQDGAVNPGESAVLEVFVENIGQNPLSGLWAELDVMDDGVDVQECQIPAYPAWLPCSASCSCHQHAQAAIVSASPGDESDNPVISLLVQVPHTHEPSLTCHYVVVKAITN